MGEEREMPNGWKLATIPEMIPKEGVFVDGDWIESKDQDPNGEVRLIQLADIGDGNFKNKSSRFLRLQRANVLNCTFLRQDDILVARMPDPIGRACLFPLKNENSFVTAVDVAIIRLGEKSVIPKYLMYSINNLYIRREIENLQSGTTRKRISRSNLAIIRFSLPPLPEQHRIVAKIEELFSSLDKGIENLKTAQRQLKVYRQAVLKWAFEGKLTNKDVKDGELPEEWVRVSLKELVDKISDGPFGSNLKTSDYVDNGVRVIRLENIGYMEFRNEFQSFVTKDKYETIKKHTVSKGDIIFSSFVSENIRAAILPDFIDRAINKADCFLVRPSEDKVTKKYLLYYFSTKEMYQQLIGEIHGATRPRINTTQLKSCQIPLAPLNEQQAIVAEIESRLSVCDKIEETIEQSLKQSESLRQSILKKAFEGKLVPQDPNDEPASVLLARIKDERESNNIETPKPRQARKTKKKAKL
jgi:type I restriction enzyme S subunit